jgi:hypothetical protein
MMLIDGFCRAKAADDTDVPPTGVKDFESVTTTGRSSILRESKRGPTPNRHDFRLVGIFAIKVTDLRPRLMPATAEREQESSTTNRSHYSPIVLNGL